MSTTIDLTRGYLGCYRFAGDPVELQAAHDRLVARFPKQDMDVHLCVATDEGLLVYDACPDREHFRRFSSSRDTIAAMVDA